MDNLLEWRKNKRKQLIASRETIPDAVHQQWSRAISDSLMQGFTQLKKMTIGIYWPFRGEYDPRFIAQHFMHLGATLALPEVIGKDEPLCFRLWTPDMPMRNGAYGIPIPIETNTVRIDAVIIPMVGFDQHGYRLGYGSGYFDRTLATYETRPLTIGIAFEMQRLDDIYPQSHDIAMHYVVTETGIFQTINNELSFVHSFQCTDR